MVSQGNSQSKELTGLLLEAAMVRQRSSVISVTFSLGWIRRQVVTALRAPGVNSAGNGVVRRSGATGVA